MMILSFAMDSVATNLAIKKNAWKNGTGRYTGHEMKWLNFMEITCKTLRHPVICLLRWAWCLIGISFGGSSHDIKTQFSCDWVSCLGSQASRADSWIALCKQTVQPMTGGKRKHGANKHKLVGNFQSLWTILVKMGIFPKIGVKIKNIWNHHLARYTLVFQISCQYVFGPPNTSWEGL